MVDVSWLVIRIRIEDEDGQTCLCKRLGQLILIFISEEFGPHKCLCPEPCENKPPANTHPRHQKYQEIFQVIGWRYEMAGRIHQWHWHEARRSGRVAPIRHQIGLSNFPHSGSQPHPWCSLKTRGIRQLILLIGILTGAAEHLVDNGERML